MGILDPEDYAKYGGLPSIPSDGTRCNASLRRKRGYCSLPPVLGGRCRLHKVAPAKGTLAYELTMSTRANYLPPDLKPRFEQLTGDAMEGLEETVRIQQAMETQLWSQMETGESHESWKILNELCKEYEYGSDTTRPQTFQRIKQVASGGLKAYGVKREILDLHERTRKQTETLSKVRKEVQETFTLEQDRERMGILLRILKLHCNNATLRAIAQDLQRASLANATNVMDIKDIQALPEGEE